jgi:hypothetical protein
MNDNKTHHDIPNHPPTVGDKRAGGQFQVTLQLNGAQRIGVGRGLRLRRDCSMSEKPL